MVTTKSWWLDHYDVGACICYGILYLLLVLSCSLIFFFKNIDKYESKLRNESKLGFFFSQLWDKITLYVIIFMHIIDQSTDIGVLLRYWINRDIILSADVTTDTRVLILFGCSLGTILLYRIISSFAVWHLTNDCGKTIWQFFDLEILNTLQLNWKLLTNRITYPTRYILFFTILQSIPNSLFSLVYILYVEHLSNLPKIVLVSFCLNLICALMHIIVADTKIFKKNSQHLGLVCKEWIRFKSKQVKQMAPNVALRRLSNEYKPSDNKKNNHDSNVTLKTQSNPIMSSIAGLSKSMRSIDRAKVESKSHINVSSSQIKHHIVPTTDDTDDDNDNENENQNKNTAIETNDENENNQSNQSGQSGQSGQNNRNNIVININQTTQSTHSTRSIASNTTDKQNKSDKKESTGSNDDVKSESTQMASLALSHSQSRNSRNAIARQQSHECKDSKDNEDELCDEKENQTTKTIINPKPNANGNGNGNANKSKVNPKRTRTPNMQSWLKHGTGNGSNKKAIKSSNDVTAIGAIGITGVVDELQAMGPNMSKTMSVEANTDNNEGSVSTDPSWDEKDNQHQPSHASTKPDIKQTTSIAISPTDIETLLEMPTGKKHKRASTMSDIDTTLADDISINTDMSSNEHDNKEMERKASDNNKKVGDSVSASSGTGTHVAVRPSISAETKILRLKSGNNINKRVENGPFSMLKRQNTIEKVLLVEDPDDPMAKQKLCFNPGFLVRVGLRIIEVTTRIGLLALLWILLANWWALPLCIVVDLVVCGIAAINNRQIDFLLFVFYFAIIGGNTRSKQEIDKFGNYYQFVAIFRFLYNYLMVIFLWTYNDEVNEISPFASLLLVYVTMCGFVLPCAFAAVLAKYAHREAKMISSNQMDIFRMAKNGECESFEELDSYGIILDLESNHPFYGCSVVHCAVSTLQKEMLEYFMKTKGLHVNIKDKQDDTPLHYACRYSGPRSIYEVTRLLLTDSQIEINAKNKAGNTPLHLLCVFGTRFDRFKKPERAQQHIMSMITIARELVASGAKTDEFNNRHYTPLHLACVNCNYPMSMLLIREYQCNVSLQTKDGNTALHLLSLYLLRIRHGSQLSASRDERRKYIKRLNECMAIAFEILQRDMSLLNIQNKSSKTVLDLALKLNDQNWVRFFSVRGATTGKEIEFHNNLRKQLQKKQRKRMKQKQQLLNERKKQKKNNYYYKPRSSISDLVYGPSAKNVLDTTFQDLNLNQPKYGNLQNIVIPQTYTVGDRRWSVTSKQSNTSPAFFDANMPLSAPTVASNSYHVFQGFPYVPTNLNNVVMNHNHSHHHNNSISFKNRNSNRVGNDDADNDDNSN